MICKNCGVNEVYKYHKGFCSKECYHEYKVGKPIHSEDSIKKRSDSLKNLHSNMSYEDKKVRYGKISESKKYKYSDEEVDNVKRLLNLKLLNLETISFKTALSKKVVKRIIDENGLKELFENKFIATPKHILSMSEEDINKFIKDIYELDYYKFSEKYSLPEKTMKRLYNFYNISKISLKETLPEKTVRNILECEKIPYKREKYLDKTIRVDFLLENNRVIEVQGDYFHANPEIYDSKLTSMQERNIKNDNRKRNFFKENGYDLLEIWEKEIKESTEEVTKKIKDFIK